MSSFHRTGTDDHQRLCCVGCQIGGSSGWSGYSRGVGLDDSRKREAWRSSWLGRSCAHNSVKPTENEMLVAVSPHGSGP